MSCPSAASAEPERDVDIVAWLRHGLLQFRGCFLEALHLEADVMNAAPALASLGARQGVVLEVQDRDIDVAIGEKVAGDALVLQLLHHLQTEVLDVEILGRLFVLRLDRDVPDFVPLSSYSWISNALILPQKLFMPGGRVASFLRVRCMRSWRPFCWGCPGLMRSMAMPSLSHQTESLERLKRAFGAGEGNTVVGADGSGQSALTEEAFEGGDGEVFSSGLQGFTEQQEAGGLVGDGERVAVSAAAELELALVIGTPQIVGGSSRGEGGPGGVVALAALAPDEAMAIEDGMDGALGGQTHMAVETADEELPDLAGAPVRLVALEGDDQAFDLGRELVGVAHRPAGAVGKGLQAVRLVAVEDLVSGLAGDGSGSHPPAGGRQSAGALPRPNTPSRASPPPACSRQAKSVTHVSGTKCHPCLGPLTANPCRTCILSFPIHFGVLLSSEHNNTLATRSDGVGHRGHS